MVMMLDNYVTEGRLETKHKRHRELTHRKLISLKKKKYNTNLDPCCYGNLLMEFHHQSNLHSVTNGHTHTSQ